MEGGELPQPRYGSRATLVGDILFVTGGVDNNNYFTSILSWDSVTESWQEAGDLAVARYEHAVVAIPTSTVATITVAMYGSQATLVGNTLYLNTPGWNGNDNTYLTSILSWDPVAGTWQAAGDLLVRRFWHGAVAVPTLTVSKFIRCTN